MKKGKNGKERNVDSLGTHSMRMKMNFQDIRVQGYLKNHCFEAKNAIKLFFNLPYIERFFEKLFEFLQDLKGSRIGFILGQDDFI